MLQRITLHLARTRAHPNGSSRHGYAITAPLDQEGHLDAGTWERERGRCRVRRFCPREPDRHGRLVHRAGGAGGATWIIDYDETTSDDDEFGYRLNTHRFVLGEYVSLADNDGTVRTYRVVEIAPLTATAIAKDQAHP